MRHTDSMLQQIVDFIRDNPPDTPIPLFFITFLVSEVERLQSLLDAEQRKKAVALRIIMDYEEDDND